MIEKKKRINSVKNLFVPKKTKSLPLIKSLLKGLCNSSGRNNLGKITAYHRGGGHKKKYRKVSFSNTNDAVGIVTSIEYDPNRNCSILSVYDLNSKAYSYKLAPKGSRIGDIIKTGTHSELCLGHSMPFKNIPIGSCLHCVSQVICSNGIISRSAGTYTKLKTKTTTVAKIVVSSGDLLHVSVSCCATLGVVSGNPSSLNRNDKAGRSRWLNKRPTVRGVAMNPIDHPHGGGEGKTSGGRTSVTPWGKPTKGGKTAKKKPTNYKKSTTI